MKTTKTNGRINVVMAGKKQGIRWDDWIIPAVEAFGKNNGIGDFSKSIKFLVRAALNHFGYFEDAYKPGIKDTLNEEATAAIITSCFAELECHDTRIIQFPVRFLGNASGSV
jgi:hypothetical protein